MQKVLTAEEMREVDRLTTEKYSIPSLLLMENAAHAAARVIVERLGGNVKGKSVLVLCGKGNNGGDGAALARILSIMGADVDVILFGKREHTKGDSRTNFDIFAGNFENEEDEGTGLFESHSRFGRLVECESKEQWVKYLFSTDQDWDVQIDAIFGTGLNRPMDVWLYNTVHDINFHNDSQINFYGKKRIRVSIDLPSGLNADKNLSLDGFPEAYEADLTITFTAPKLANVFPPASNFNGELVVANIGSPQELIDNSPSKLFVAEKEDAKNWLTSTTLKSNSYKKTRGTTLIIAGSENYSGAAVLSANACFAAGAGMVSVAVPKSVKEIVANKTSDEIIVKALENIDVSTEKVDVVAIGCGLNNDAETHQFIRQSVINRQTPMILDAEALNALAPFNLQGSDEFPLVLTPHLGEFKRLLGREIGEDKIAEVREFAQKHNVIVVLKGERSLIAKPDGTVVINPTGNAGISRAGAGDTLTGIITSFIAQTLQTQHIRNKIEFNATEQINEIFKAVVAALYVAGLAGEIAAEKFSERLMTATDVRNCLQNAMERINE